MNFSVSTTDDEVARGLNRVYVATKVSVLAELGSGIKFLGITGEV
jgi:hypothetical protein